MADVENEPRHYPKILELKEIESGIHLFLNNYKTFQKDYVQSVNSGDTDKAAHDLAALDVINNVLMSGVDMAKSTMDEVYPLGVKNQHTIQSNNPKLRKMARQLNRESDMLNNMIRKNSDLDGELENTKLNSKSSYIKYIIMTILLIIVAGLTIRSYIVPNSNSIETIILVAAIALCIYFIFKKVF
jgi:hypothetical protein